VIDGYMSVLNSSPCVVLDDQGHYIADADVFYSRCWHRSADVESYQ